MTNEDRFVARPPLFLVADGMGGQNAGEVAAAITADLVEAAAVEGGLRAVDDLAAALGRANAAVWRRAGTDRTLEGMGTTCTAAIVAGPRLLVAHVGDSRAYLLRGGEMRQLTIDHTLMQRLVDEGRLAPADVASHPQRSVIIRAIGAAADLAPDRIVVELEPADRLLLCSDGLSGPVPADDIQRALADNRDPQLAAERLVDLANAAGGGDNVTAVVVDPDRVEAAFAGQDHPASEQASIRQAALSKRSGWRRASRRRTALGALLLVLTLGIASLAAAVALAPLLSPAATPAAPSPTPPGTPAQSPSPSLPSPRASSATSPVPSGQSPPNLVPAPSPITGTAS